MGSETHLTEEGTQSDREGLRDAEGHNYERPLRAPIHGLKPSHLPRLGSLWMGLGTHSPAPGGKLEVGRQLHVGPQHGEQAQKVVHDLQGHEGQQVLLPVLKSRPSTVTGPLHSTSPHSS